jgi:SAM-dependent methyltransferase
MASSQNADERVRRRFTAEASEFDDLYEDERLTVRLLRPGLFRRRNLAVETVAALPAPRVLDVGCGSGRVGEFVLAAGAARYVGIDFAEPMIDLARARLERPESSGRCKLIAGDFLTTGIGESFDVILALGLFDYIADPESFTRRMADVANPGACVVASFPTWSLLKGPIRKVRYEWIGDCPIFNYTRVQIHHLFQAVGFGEVEVLSPGHSGYLVRASLTAAPSS